ncbi:MAG: cytochrome c oxidase accessory protein CcoG [Crocinitomicaceae bacterium]|nr:cytochrome c oxidase accessory protein CcoG [Crocinitomicaceae bacterium]|tara:strand:+ start:8472 stop:9890 length:1419 start_codon:yes stop_codon:yes gene_type:complete
MSDVNTERQFKPDDSFRDSIGTIDDDGKRHWIFAKKPKGKLYNYRSIVSILLLTLLFAGPWIRIDGEPFLLLNITESKFSIFGQVFWPQDIHLFAFAMITGVVFIVLFTVVFGRVFCGWLCPQTIFMEMVFRKIEYFIDGDFKHQRKLDKQPWNAEKIRKRVLKHGIFFMISVAISNTFLAYIIGSDELVKIQTSNPMDHLAGLSLLIVFSGVFYGVFARFREQVCIAVCPYGRLQGVMLDRNSVVVAYNYVRGEGRGRWKGKKEVRSEVGKGDCIDCGACVDVCPTGIDIRNGTQLECVNCTACIDACDSMMEGVGLSPNLIGYYSENDLAEGKKFKFSARIKAYTAVLIILTITMGGLIFGRTDVETSILRTPGMLYMKTEDGQIKNLYNYKVVNKTNNDFDFEIRLVEREGSVNMVGQKLHVDARKVTEGAMFVIIPRESLDGRKTKIEFEVWSEGRKLETVKANFLGP